MNKEIMYAKVGVTFNNANFLFLSAFL